mmetsp:Transcript_40382/g.65480  ORF Transcript_40382/g.65480 Transcript_40382/m.65480 type:complete len:210 (-) Transcript_40382:1456-2085(-)
MTQNPTHRPLRPHLLRRHRRYRFFEMYVFRRPMIPRAEQQTFYAFPPDTILAVKKEWPVRNRIPSAHRSHIPYCPIPYFRGSRDDHVPRRHRSRRDHHCNHLRNRLRRNILRCRNSRRETHQTPHPSRPVAGQSASTAKAELRKYRLGHSSLAFQDQEDRGVFSTRRLHHDDHPSLALSSYCSAHVVLLVLLCLLCRHPFSRPFLPNFS